MLPNFEGEEGLETMGHGVVRIGVLGNGEFAFGIGLEPDPAGAEEARAFETFASTRTVDIGNTNDAVADSFQVETAWLNEANACF